MNEERKYMVIEDGCAIVLTKDRQGVSCWTMNQYEASMMSFDEAIRIAEKTRRFYGAGVQIVGRHCVVAGSI
jgi:hypothetical protein